MSTVSEVIDQSERVLEEIEEVDCFISELQGYINELKSMVDNMRPVHWDGGDRLDQAFLDSLKSEISDIEMTANDFSYDVGQIEDYTSRLLGAIEDLEEMEEEEEEGA